MELFPLLIYPRSPVRLFSVRFLVIYSDAVQTCGVMLRKVVSIFWIMPVITTLPVNAEVSLRFLVFEPIEAHIQGLRSFLIDNARGETRRRRIVSFEGIAKVKKQSA